MALLLGPRDFFNDQAGHWIPACISIRVSISSTVSNVDPNTDFALVNVDTVALYCSGSVAVCVCIAHPHHCVNRQRTAALGAIKGDEPSLTAAVAVHKEAALVNNAESSVIFLLVENAVLRNNLPRLHKSIQTERRSFVPKIYITRGL